jgi:hypothetical protein
MGYRVYTLNIGTALKQRSFLRSDHKQTGSPCNNGGTVGNGVFCSDPCRGVIRWTTEWKGIGIQRGLEPGNRGIAIARSRYQATINKDIAVY